MGIRAATPAGRQVVVIGLFLAAVGLIAWVMSLLALPGDGTVGGHLLQAILVGAIAYRLTFLAWPRRSGARGGRSAAP